MIDRIIAAGEAYGTRDEMEARLEAIGDLGYEMRASLVVDACTNISVPVRDHIGAVVAALTVPFIPQRQARFDRAAVLHQTLAAGSRVSAALGAPEHTV